MFRLGGPLPKIEFGAKSDFLDRVINAFAAECGLPLTRGDYAYLRSVQKEFNEMHKTNVRFVNEDWGYWIDFDGLQRGSCLKRSAPKTIFNNSGYLTILLRIDSRLIQRKLQRLFDRGDCSRQFRHFDDA